MRPFLLFLATVTPFVAGYNYLVFDPLFGHSHTKFIGKVADTLTNAGHNVMDLSEGMMTDYKNMFTAFHATMWDQEADPRLLLAMGDLMAKTFSTMCRDVITRADIIAELKSRNFDAGISEPFFLCGLGLFEHLGIPATIAASSGPPIDLVSKKIGQPIEASWVPGWSHTDCGLQKPIPFI